MSLTEIRKHLQALANKETAQILQSFFKTGPGQYGEGDIFIGVKVPPLRRLSGEFQTASLSTVKSLLSSTIHEERTLALMILVRKFVRADERAKQGIYEFYLQHLRYINNWDLIDGSAPYIVGPYLWNHDRKPLYVLARSASLWERRIAILSTFYFIRQGEFRDALKIAEILLQDDHDLIHKAVGWMLREIGNRKRAVEESFLKKHYLKMPRTMLRYAIERFPESKRQRYLRGKV